VLGARTKDMPYKNYVNKRQTTKFRPLAIKINAASTRTYYYIKIFFEIFSVRYVNNVTLQWSHIAH